MIKIMPIPSSYIVVIFVSIYNCQLFSDFASFYFDKGRRRKKKKEKNCGKN